MSPGPRNDNRRDRDYQEKKEFEETVIHVARVARVVKGGRRFRFRALVAIGDGKDRVGVGISKGADVQIAVTKAVDVAKKNMITIALHKDTIPHDTLAKVSGSSVFMKPAAPGTGLIAGGTVRSILELTGVRNILSKLHGSTNKVNVAYATMKALSQLTAKSKWRDVGQRTSQVKATKPAVAKNEKTKTSTKPKAPAKPVPAKVKKAAKK